MGAHAVEALRPLVFPVNTLIFERSQRGPVRRVEARIERVRRRGDDKSARDDAVLLAAVFDPVRRFNGRLREELSNLGRSDIGAGDEKGVLWGGFGFEEAAVDVGADAGNAVSVYGS